MRSLSTLHKVMAAAALLACSPLHAQEPIQVITPPKAGDHALIELGKQLFFDPRQAESGYISSNSCHNLGMAGTPAPEPF